MAHQREGAVCALSITPTEPNRQGHPLQGSTPSVVVVTLPTLERI